MASATRTPADPARIAPAGAGPADPFAPLPELLRPLAERGVVRDFRKDERVIEEGQRGDELYIILAGRLRSCARNDRGREITYGIYGPGEYLGEMSLDGGPRSASVVAMEKSRCVMVTRQSLLAQIRERPEFALELIAKVIGRARAATESARGMALSDAYGRLKQLLESLVHAGPRLPQAIEEPLTHRDIASRVGCSREMVTRLMKDLEEGGYLAVVDQRMHIVRALPARW
jgi:CRP/FNR family cyclic AMP-dependent transcriptional regulator